MHIYVHSLCVFVCMCVWKSEVSVECLPELLFAFFESGCPIEPGAVQFCRLPVVAPAVLSLSLSSGVVTH